MTVITLSKYTTELRYIVESGFDLGLKEYPIFDAYYRPLLNKKIIDHYWLREIGTETAGLFRHFLNIKMNEIMPYYNEMYKSTLVKYDPLETYNIKEDSLVDKNNTTTITTADNTKSTLGQKALSSDTPAGKLDDPFSIEYANQSSQNTAENKTENNGTSKAEDNGADKITKNLKGKNDSKSYAELIILHRQSIINIDMMVIDELKELFFGLW